MSSSALMMERSHFEMGWQPVADAFDTATGTTDVVNMKNHNRVRFIIVWGVGATGTFTPVVEACDDVTPSNVSAIAYKYRVTVAAAAPGAITAAASTGFTTTAGSSQIVEIEVTAADLLASGYSYIRLKCTEVVNSPILGGILIEMLEPRHAGPTQGSEVA
jgi:hypothetical protein